ncbi:MAG: hypothetical protein RLZ75_1503 [Pseudomonadota bacterium]
MFISKNKLQLGVHSLALSIAIVLVSGCAELPKCCGDSPALQAKKNVVRVTDSNVAELINTRAVFHDAALNPELYVTQYPLYLLGIEKPRTNTSDFYKKAFPKFDINNLQIPDKKDIEDVLDDGHTMVLTHALKTKQSDLNQNQKECFIYNVYKTKESASWCKHNHIIQIKESDESWKQEGWNGLKLLGDEIKEAVQHQNGGKATHIIVLATGWNTEEYESYWDFKAWMDQLTEDFKGKGDFRPIFVGISWESQWGWSEVFSFANKGNDADEIGFTWANYLLNDILKPIVSDSDVQLVAIGHSFGSRIVMGSHYARKIIVRHDENAADTTPVTLIGLQAAFPTGRFSKDRGKKHPYNTNYKDPATVVITTSTKDKATGMINAFTTGYIGGEGGIEELTEKKDDYKSAITLFDVVDVDKMGQPTIKDLDKTKVSVYNATPFVECELQGTSSGAHSDVYDKAMGHFLGEIIRKSK